MTAKIVDAFVTNYMQHSEPIVAKASDVEEQSDGIVVSFGSEWYQPLCQRKFRAVIRKRIPKTLKPAWLYFHVNAPVSAICARAQIRAVRELKLDEANVLSHAGKELLDKLAGFQIGQRERGGKR